jgi:hypothetical protein
VEYDYRACPTLMGGFRYWTQKRGRHITPARRDIDPTEVPQPYPLTKLISVSRQRLSCGLNRRLLTLRGAKHQ